ncbi:hypothetical protein ACEOSW_16960 [Pseudomonas aeruginosa]|uniref:hypothetical protein n=1 Tax=Pseudomonas aeruginosa TaxID=287 RepID=UPI00128F5F31|nr:hypothetical protein [Pseudomonas aeruginosa]MDK8375975.1 hypothetical protein [Pseudomonas aeruginosa]MQH02216.1 hypothetical protein [Pseudomonas aeruginosa]
MASIKVAYLKVSSPTGTAIYDSRVSSETLYAVPDPQMKEFKVVLKCGTYTHFGDPAGNGEFELELAVGGCLKGFVEKSVPDQTPDGVNTPDSLELLLRVE